jgi:hypothetical protein
MIVLRREQLDAMREARVREFAQETVARLRRDVPAAARHDDDALRAFAEQGAEQARRYGIDRFDDLARLVDFMCAHGSLLEADEERPWIRGMLSSPALDGTAKVDAILRYTEFLQRRHM